MKTAIFRLVASWALLSLSVFASASVKVGQPAPALEVVTFEGSVFRLAQFRGKIIIVHFWATWCPACRREMAVLSRFYRKNRKRLEMIALSLDRPRDRELASKMVRELALPGAILSEAKVNEFGAPGLLPITYVIDDQGVIRRIFLPEAGAGRQGLTESELAGVTE